MGGQVGQGGQAYTLDSGIFLLNIFPGPKVFACPPLPPAPFQHLFKILTTNYCVVIFYL